MFTNLTLKSRILCSFFVYILGLSLPGCFATAYFYSYPEKFAQTAENLEFGVADRLAESKVKIQESLLNYVSTKDDFFINSYDRNYLKFNQQIQLLNESTSTSNIDVASLPKLKTLSREFNDLNQYIFTLIKSGKTEQAFRVMGADETRKLFADIAEEIEKIKKNEASLKAEKTQQIESELKTLFLILGLATLVLTLMAIAISFPLANRILGTANQMITKLLKISGAIAQEMNTHESATHEQAQIVSITTPQVEDFTAFCNFATEKTASIYKQLEEISIHALSICDQLEQIKSLRELSDRLVYQSKKLSVNVSVKAWRDHPETSKSFVLLNTELRTLTNDVQKLSQNLNEILRNPQILDQPVSLTTPTWGNNRSESKAIDSFLNDRLDSEINHPINHNIFTELQNISLQIYNLAMSSQEQSANSEKLLQTNQGLEEIAGTTACGISETNIQIQKLKQIGLNLKRFLGIRQ